MKKYLLFKLALMFFLGVLSLGSNAQNGSEQKINIKDFKVEKSQNKVVIQWATDKNIATNYFEVEKSNDGKNFKTVAYVMGEDPTKTDCDCYGCFDKITANTKKFYYRLKHVSTDGEVEFSEVKMLALK